MGERVVELYGAPEQSPPHGDSVTLTPLRQELGLAQHQARVGESVVWRVGIWEVRSIPKSLQRGEMFGGHGLVEWTGHSASVRG